MVLSLIIDTGIGKGRGKGFQEVSIKVFDIHGQLIKNLVPLPSPLPSRLEARWDATGLPSGLYLIRATIGNRTLEKRAYLLK